MTLEDGDGVLDLREEQTLDNLQILVTFLLDPKTKQEQTNKMSFGLTD